MVVVEKRVELDRGGRESSSWKQGRRGRKRREERVKELRESLFLRGERIFLSERFLFLSFSFCSFAFFRRRMFLRGKSSRARNANANARCIQLCRDKFARTGRDEHEF